MNFWTTIIFPNGSEYQDMAPISFVIAPHEVKTQQTNKMVPVNSRIGSYIFNVYIGNYPKVWGKDHFIINVVSLGG